MAWSNSLILIFVLIASSLSDLAESKRKKRAAKGEGSEEREACGPVDRGSVMAAAAVALSPKARKNPSAALDFVQKEHMAIDNAEKKECVKVVEEASRYSVTLLLVVTRFPLSRGCHLTQSGLYLL